MGSINGRYALQKRMGHFKDGADIDLELVKANLGKWIAILCLRELGTGIIQAQLLEETYCIAANIEKSKLSFYVNIFW